MDEAQIYTRDTRTCTIFILTWGSNWESSGFLVNKITAVRQVQMSLHLLLSECEDKILINHRISREDRGRIVLACVAGKILKTQTELHG